MAFPVGLGVLAILDKIVASFWYWLLNNISSPHGNDLWLKKPKNSPPHGSPSSIWINTVNWGDQAYELQSKQLVIESNTAILKITLESIRKIRHGSHQFKHEPNDNFYLFPWPWPFGFKCGVWRQLLLSNTFILILFSS